MAKKKGTRKKKEEQQPNQKFLPAVIPKKGRPSLYSPEVADEICFIIATSSKGLEVLCVENEVFPAYSTLRRWIFSNKDFQDRYARAKRLQADFLGEEIIEISDHTAEDHTPFTGANVVNRDKLRVDARKWVMSKLNPKKYGDKVEISGDQENPVVLKITGMKIT